MTEPTPTWLKKQNLTIDLYDTIKPRMDYEVKTKNDGMIRAVAKEVIQAGYRRIAKINVAGNVPRYVYNDLYDIIKPRVSVWVQINQDDLLRKILSEIIYVGYRETPKYKKGP